MSASLPSAPAPHFSASEPRLLLMSQPPGDVLAQMTKAVTQHGLAARLGEALFCERNWHQSWSGRYADTPTLRARLERVGDRVSAPMFTQTFHRIGGQGHWTLLGKGRSGGFNDVLGSVQTALRLGGLHAPGHTPHLTISYRAPEPLPPVPIRPIAWLVDTLLLVAGAGMPYRYEVIAQWKLARPAESRQLSLF